MIGGYYNNVLSNNTANIESNLFGIKQIDLTKKQEKFVPSLNKLDCLEFLNTKSFCPRTISYSKGQRPIGPYWYVIYIINIYYINGWIKYKSY